MPEHVKDYIDTGRSQSASKPDTGSRFIQGYSENLALEMEKLDLAKLIQQTVADMEEQITASGLPSD